MSQTVFHQESKIQDKMIEILQSKDTRAYALVALVRTKGTIDPLIIVVDDMPGQQEFIKEFYALCDKHMHFKITKRVYEEEFKKTK